MENFRQDQTIRFEHPEPDTLLLKLSGSWILRKGLYSVSEVESAVESDSGVKNLAFDTKAVTDWDSGFVIFLRKIADFCRQKDIAIDDDGLPEGVRKLFRLATAVPVVDTHDDPMASSLLTRVGDISIRLTKTWGDTLTFIGEVFLSFLRFLRGKARFRRTDLWNLIEEVGAQALPIVTLINFLIGIILAFVGAIQLQAFGAEIYVADLVAIAIVREMGPMMTAIIVAGRSGAAFAAHIGTMVVNEEVDALKTMGISPIDFLVTPRLLALSLMMPLLALYADFIGILGGAVIGQTILSLPFRLYYTQTIASLNPLHFLLGLIKAGIYGSLVAFAGCMTGMHSGRSAAAVGAATTKAVVNSIVLIIVASALTTIIYSLFGW